MSTLDSLIANLYGTATEPDWRVARERGLEFLRQHFGARSAAWITTSEAGAGVFTTVMSGDFSRAGLGALKFTAAEAVQPISVNGLPACAVRYGHAGSTLVSVVALCWANGRKPAEGSALQSAVAHLSEASALVLRLFVQRDEWLLSMGRSNRGAAALVDARGVVHAGTDRFRSLLEGRNLPSSRLPFELPDLRGEERTALVHEGIHARVEAMDGLYLVHLRLPLPLDILSPREQQIARALGAGKTFKSVGKQCDIAVSTVANHATRIYRKLGIFRREELVELIRSPGLIEAKLPSKLR